MYRFKLSVRHKNFQRPALETLVGAETSKAHLEVRVAELTKQLQGNEENLKLVVYEHCSSSIIGMI